MSIARRLMIIVLLTILEVSITIWAAFQISKGATFHQLNSLHLKYNTQFLDQVIDLENGSQPDIEALKATIYLVREQPVECLKQAGWMDKKIMRLIGTYYALELCEKDIADADRALLLLNKFTAEQLSKIELVKTLRQISDEFAKNSSAFEDPVTSTVEFIFRTMIPMIIFISLFNISLIIYLSRTISGSIRHTIGLLSKSAVGQSLSQQLQVDVSGELKELLTVAQERIEQDFMNIETNKKLQKLVDDQTASLRTANEELEHFSYRTSHDLKGPLTRSKRMCRFILEDINKGRLEEACGNVKTIEKQMATLETLVEDLMSLAKADLVESSVEEIRFQEVVQQIIENQRTLIEENKVHFTPQISKPDYIRCERIRLVQILDNLFSNSCKYADKNKETSWIRLAFSSGDNGYIIAIEDNGIGFPEQHRSDIFTQFKRFHPDTSSGSGLGLSIVKKHVEKMNGTIEYTDTQDGTKFSITLPATEN